MVIFSIVDFTLIFRAPAEIRHRDHNVWLLLQLLWLLRSPFNEPERKSSISSFEASRTKQRDTTNDNWAFKMLLTNGSETDRILTV